MRPSAGPAHARAPAKSSSPGRKKKTRPQAKEKERRASPPKQSKAPASPPAARAPAVPNHFAQSAFQNSPDPKLVPLPDFDLGVDSEPPIGHVAIEQTASLRRILNLA